MHAGHLTLPRMHCRGLKVIPARPGRLALDRLAPQARRCAYTPCQGCLPKEYAQQRTVRDVGDACIGLHLTARQADRHEQSSSEQSAANLPLRLPALLRFSKSANTLAMTSA